MEGTNIPHDARIHKLHPDSPEDLSRNPQTMSLMVKIREECDSMNTGWRCSIGFATRGSTVASLES